MGRAASSGPGPKHNSRKGPLTTSLPSDFVGAIGHLSRGAFVVGWVSPPGSPLVWQGGRRARLRSIGTTTKERYIWEEPPRAGLGPRPRTCGKVRRQLPSFPTHFNFVGEIGLLPRVAFSTGKPLCVAGWSASAPPKHRYYYKQGRYIWEEPPGNPGRGLELAERSEDNYPPFQLISTSLER